MPVLKTAGVVLAMLWIGSTTVAQTAARGRDLQSYVRTNQIVTAEMIEVKVLPLEEAGCNNQLTPVLVANDPKGGMWVAWGVSGGAAYRIQHLNEAIEPDRPVIRLETNAVVGLYGHADGSLAFTWFPGSHTRIFGVELHLRKISAAGKTIWDSKVRGDPGSNLEYAQRPIGIWYHPDFQGPTVPIAFNGKQYGLFYCILQKFPEPSCHTGDEFSALDKNGKLLGGMRSTWNASHSFWESVVAAPDGSFFGITLADPFPFRAIRMGNYSVSPAKQDLLWPAKPCNNFFPPDTKLSAAFNLGRDFAMAISTAIPKDMEDKKTYDDKTLHEKIAAQGPGAYPVLLMFDKNGRKAKATYLAGKPAEDMIIAGARFGRYQVAVLWANGPAGMDKGSVFGAYPVKMAILNDEGRALQVPIEVKAPLTWHSEATTLNDGDVAWGAIADDWTPVDDARKLYVVRIHCHRPKSSLPSGSATNSPAGP